ncbi:MAG: ATP synthase F1 subunit gamma [Sarcina sp.]
MSTSGLLEIKRRINSVKNTQKITRAMGLISISKLRHAREKLNDNNMYFNKLSDIKKHIFYISRNERNIFINKNDSKIKLFIVFASDSGLCGSFNGACLDYLNNKYEKEKENIKIIVIGNRGFSYIKKYGLNLYKGYSDLDSSEGKASVKEIVVDAMELFLSQEVGEVSFIYMSYKSAIKQIVLEEKILPLDNEFSDGETGDYDKMFSLGTDINILLRDFIYRYFEGKLINCTFDSKTSEQSIRMQTMNAATSNADEILKNLNAKYNRIRQSAITQEISEIISGAKAQD